MLSRNQKQIRNDRRGQVGGPRRPPGCAAHGRGTRGLLVSSAALFILCASAEARLPAAQGPSQGDAALAKQTADLKKAADRIAAGDVGSAESLLQGILKEHAKAPEALALLGVIRAEQGKQEEAEKLLRDAIQIRPKLAMAHENLALLLEKTGRADEALREYASVLSIQPQNRSAKDRLASLSEKQALAARANGDRQGALGILLVARDAGSGEPRILLDLGLLELEMGLNKDALQTLEAGRRAAPQDSQMLYGLARAELAVQDMPATERHMREYLTQRPDDATAHYGLGRILRMLERPGEAEAELRRSIEIEPNQTASYYELGDIALTGGNFEAASALFQKVLARDPRHGGALTGSGIAAYRQKQYDVADGFLKSAVESSPGYQPAHYYYALNLKRLGRTEESNREMQIALDLDAQAKAPQTRQQLILEPPADKATPSSVPH
ncbi:MAG: tetratricopeptide repeat protein [Candidatus Acidiferrum sp.]|jgi:tetratricopeptide (TPR) repeat protein